LAELGALDSLDPTALRAGIIPERISRRLWTVRLDNVWLSRPAAGPAGPAGAAVEKARFNFIQRYNAELEDPTFVPRAMSDCTDPPSVPDECEMETDPGQPLLPAILEGSWAGGGLSLSGRARYHHQKSMVVETGLTMAKKIGSRAAMSVSYRENKFQYLSLDNVLHAAGKTLAFSGEKKSSHRVKMGVQGHLNLADDTPSERRLENARVFVDYTTPCYGLTVSYQQKITATTGPTDAIVDRSILITFSLGRNISIQSVQTLGGG
ncbi:MAG: hypothetical protein V3S29_05600, partial [bacterium]